MLIRKDFKHDTTAGALKTSLRVLLIRKDFKRCRMDCEKQDWFESLVNTEGFQTLHLWNTNEGLFESLVNTEGFQTTITMLLTTAVLLVSVLMTGCTSLTEPKNSTPSGTDALTESDGFGVYIKLERDDTSSIALRGFLDYERLVCEKDSYI